MRGGSPAHYLLSLNSSISGPNTELDADDIVVFTVDYFGTIGDTDGSLFDFYVVGTKFYVSI